MGHKIAIVSDWYLPRIGGLELHLRDLARELNARGHEAHVITATPGERRARRHQGASARRAAHARARHHPQPRRRCGRSRRCSRASATTSCTAHTALSPLAIGATYVAQKLGIPSVMTEHSVLRGAGLALLSTLHKLWGWADWPDVLTAVSHYVAKDMRDVSGRKDVYVLPNGINPRDWKPRSPPRPGERAAAARDHGDALHQAQAPARGRARDSEDQRAPARRRAADLHARR